MRLLKKVYPAVLALCTGTSACESSNHSGVKDVAMAGTSTGVVLNCVELGVAGSTHFRADVIGHFHDFTTRYEAQVFDNLVSRDVAIASITACTGSIVDKSLSCTTPTGHVGPAGFRKVFALENLRLPTVLAKYSQFRDFGPPTEVSLSCKEPTEVSAKQDSEADVGN